MNADDEQLYECTGCHLIWNGHAQCDCMIEGATVVEFEPYELDQEYDDGLPGNPWIYRGSDADDDHIEERQLESMCQMYADSQKDIISHKKKLCLDLIDLLEDNKEELGSGKYVELCELLKTDLYDKLGIIKIEPRNMFR